MAAINKNVTEEMMQLSIFLLSQASNIQKLILDCESVFFKQKNRCYNPEFEFIKYRMENREKTLERLEDELEKALCFEHDLLIKSINEYFEKKIKPHELIIA